MFEFTIEGYPSCGNGYTRERNISITVRADSLDEAYAKADKAGCAVYRKTACVTAREVGEDNDE